MQRFHYDSENRLIHAQIWQGTTLSSEARYQYDAVGRRIGKQATLNEQTQHTRFLWQGLRLLQEQHAERRSLYIYEPGSYAPLARVDNNPEHPEQEARHYYFHTDQIGTPQEMTDADGHVVWRAYYKAWGGLEALSPNVVEQNLRFQGQYHDRETGLYYNTFRYYDPAVGRFTTQDPIGLMGGDNLYRYAPNAMGWIDPWGLSCSSDASKLARSLGAAPGAKHNAHHIVMSNSKDIRMRWLRRRMKKFGVGINDEANGIWLPNKAINRLPSSKATAHAGEGVHGIAYKQHVWNTLKGSKTKVEFETGLAKLQDQRKNGKIFPTVR